MFSKARELITLAVCPIKIATFKSQKNVPLNVSKDLLKINHDFNLQCYPCFSENGQCGD